MGRRPGHIGRLVVSRCRIDNPLADVVAGYLAAIAARGLSPYTVAYRAQVLARFTEWADQRGVTEPAGVSRQVLESYQRHLFYRRKADGTPLRFVSQHNQLVAVKSLFSWATRTGLIAANPASEIDLPKIERTLPKDVLTPAHIEQVLAVPDLDTVIGLRDRAMMEILYSTGMRRAELCNLRLADLDFERQTVTVRQGKGRRDRVVPVGERALVWVQRYLVDAGRQLGTGAAAAFLFVSRDGADLTPDHLTIRVGRYIRQATGRAGSCHAFRHAMATAMLEAGADVRYVQEMLGHARLETCHLHPRHHRRPQGGARRLPPRRHQHPAPLRAHHRGPLAGRRHGRLPRRATSGGTPP